MIKKIFRLILVLLIIIIPYKNVFALEQHHVVLVDRIDITGKKMTGSGYAFISHRDNWGIEKGSLKDSSIGNLENYIVAYTDSDINNNDDNSNNDWTSTYSSIDACESSPNCYAQRVFPKTSNKPAYNDLYYSRCRGAACERTYYRDLVSRVNSTYDFNDGELEPTSIGKCTSVGGVSACLYYNISFSFSLELDELVEDLFNGRDYIDDENINFAIVSVITGTGSVGSETIKVSSFGVYGSNCTFNNSTPCSAGNYHNLGLYKIKLGRDSLANRARFDAANASAYTTDTYNSDGSSKFSYTRDLSEPVIYNILGWSGLVSRAAYGGRNFTDYLIKLDAKKVSGSQYVVPEYNGGDGFYSLASWVSLQGSFQITSWGPRTNELTCSNVFGINSNKTSGNVNCKNNKEDNLVECSEASVGGGADGPVVYYKVTSDDTTKTSSGIYRKGSEIMSSLNVKAKNADDKDDYFLPINVNADILVYQKGTFSFDDFSSGSVYAGKGFGIDNSVSDGIVYKTEIGWAARYQLISNGEPFFKYSVVDSPNDFSWEDRLDTKKYSTDGVFYYPDGQGEFEDNDLITASIGAINYYLKKDKFYNTDMVSDAKSVVANKFKFKSCDSNKSTTNCVGTSDYIEVNENWEQKILYQLPNDQVYETYYEGKYFGAYYRRDYYFELPHAYIVLGDKTPYKNGDVIYSPDPAANNLFDAGNKYYVGFKYTYENSSGFDFPFNLEESYVSLVEGMVWKLSGICGVDVVDGYYTDSGGTGTGTGKLKLLYKYRSISTSNAFPKVGGNYNNITAVNWKKWYLREDGTVNGSNEERIINSYNNLDYKVTFAKNSDSSFDISDIETCGSTDKCSSGYGRLNKFRADGTSEFVDGYFSTKPNGDTHYCGLGLFSESCNAVN